MNSLALLIVASAAVGIIGLAVLAAGRRWLYRARQAQHRRERIVLHPPPPRRGQRATSRTRIIGRWWHRLLFRAGWWR